MVTCFLICDVTQVALCVDVERPACLPTFPPAVSATSSRVPLPFALLPPLLYYRQPGVVRTSVDLRCHRH